MTALTPEQMRALASTPYADTIDMRAALRAAADQLEQLTEWVATPAADTAPQKERDE